jgi:hypothetical protein
MLAALMQHFGNSVPITASRWYCRRTELLQGVACQICWIKFYKGANTDFVSPATPTGGADHVFPDRQVSTGLSPA